MNFKIHFVNCMEKLLSGKVIETSTKSSPQPTTLHTLVLKMKFGFALLATIVSAEAFSSIKSSQISRTTLREKISEELDLPCEDECAIKSFPNLPESVHPGVLSGQAMMDLLDHAKENGESLLYLLCLCLIVIILLLILDITIVQGMPSPP